MSLLTKIAISNGNKERKAEANKLLATKDRHKIANWHHRLQTKVDSQQAKGCPSQAKLQTKPIG